MRFHVRGPELERLAKELAADAAELAAVRVPQSDAVDVGHHRLAHALTRFDRAADVGVARLQDAAVSMSRWMLRTVDVAEADDDALAAELRKAAPDKRSAGNHTPIEWDITE